MRKIYFIFLLIFTAIMPVSAQYTVDGYYRVCNKGSNRYIYVTDNTGSYDMTRDEGDFAALQLWLTKGRDYISDPGSIIYINKKSATQYDLRAQNTGIYALVARYVDVTPVTSGPWKGTYTVSASEKGITKYLSDNERTADINQGTMGTGGSTPYRNWTVTPVDVATSCYFGITPNVQVGNKFYYPFYAAFPFTCKSSGMKVYTITKVDEGMAVLKELTGMIPASTPVLIECVSNDPSNNRLNLEVSSAAAPTDNQLRGVYFANPKRPKSKSAITAFNASTMRVLGKTKDGKLGFVSASDNLYSYNGTLYLPANQSYLPVKSGTETELTIVTEDEYKATILANKKYNLTFVVDGKTYTTLQFKAGETITPPAAPTKEGYTFDSWINLPSTMPANDLTVTAAFKVNTYTLTYVVDGNTYQTVKVEYGTAITPIAAPTKEGHTFSGWSNVPKTMPAKDVTITGTFKANNYKLIYVVDGQNYQTQIVPYGTTITPAAAPNKEGYTFSGWSAVPATMPANDVTVTGTFSVNTYTLTYVVDGNTYQTQKITFGGAIAPVDAPAKEGYTFTGWSDVIPAVMPARDITVSAIFQANTYTLTYVVDGDTYQTLSVVYGTAITPVEAPIKQGYTFGGWSEVPTTMPANDVIVTGTFLVNTYTLTYVVNGEEYASFSIEYGAAITPLEAPEKEGYLFSGWSNIPETMPAQNVTITGNFTAGAYTLTYYVDGEVYKVFNYDFGTAISPIEAPYREGYSFSGWDEVPATMPAHDVDINGNFLVNSYTVTFMVDGAPYQTVQIEYGTSLSTIENPVKEGYTFSGWSNMPETMPAYDITVYGSFRINRYTLTYVLDGEVYQTFTLTYGATIFPLKSLTKEGYTFSGWSEIPATMPAQDFIITGSFSVNYYTVTYMMGDEVLYQELVAYGDAVPDYTFEQEKYPTLTFLGWVGKIYETMPAHDVTIFADIYDGIRGVRDNERDQHAYDLNGRQLQRLPARGVYVRNGKKYLITNK